MLACLNNGHTYKENFYFDEEGLRLEIIIGGATNGIVNSFYYRAENLEHIIDSTENAYLKESHKIPKDLNL